MTTLAPGAESLPHVPDADRWARWGQCCFSPGLHLLHRHTHSHPLGVVERWSWAGGCGTGGVVLHGLVGEF